eukprot:COSAG01_NODE_2087_length_8456_cov_2.656456_13_plen_64_part_00
MVPGGSDVRSACMSGGGALLSPASEHADSIATYPYMSYPAVASVQPPARPPSNGERTDPTWVS